jgi:lactoylglutathione lyase
LEQEGAFMRFNDSIEGLFETHIDVADLERARHFYETVIGLELAYLETKRRIAFYRFGTKRQSMLGVWEKPPEEKRVGHFAFSVAPETILNIQGQLKKVGLDPRNFFDDGTDALYVFPWLPAVSIYFRDPDGNSLEFLAILSEAPRPDLELLTWDTWKDLQRKDLHDNMKG